MLREMFALLAGSIPIYAYLNPTGFYIACVGGVLLAGALWWLCTIYARLWNTAFHLSFLHHTLCALAALCTVFVMIAFASVSDVGQKADQEISAWKVQMHQSLESDSTLPTADDATPTTTPTTGAALLGDFEASHPFLRKVLEAAQIALPEQGTDDTVPQVKAIDETAATIATVIQIHLEFLLIRLRAALLLLLLLAQVIPFGLNGYLAHRDIRPSS
jgi:hypothetical protein